ncbi:MAG: hypothetical protein ACREUU_11085 [Gammaproteobacteria bacterium]
MSPHDASSRRIAGYSGAVPALCAAMLCYSGWAAADWAVVSQRENNDTTTTIARTNNPDGYSLEIYRDAVGAVRSRFTLRDGLLRLVERDCPTYQIDKGKPINRSINSAPCLSTERWSEYVLGYVVDSRVESRNLLSFMNGINIYFRFRLASGDYRETQFSLLGSKRSLSAALGADVSVSVPR